MKTALKLVTLSLLILVLVISGCARKKLASWTFVQNPAVSAQIQSFVAGKEAEAKKALKANGQAMPPEIRQFFAAAEKGDWSAVNADFTDLEKRSQQGSNKANPHTLGTAWQAVVEIWGTFDSMAEGNEKYSTLYANEIINSIPPGSVYFGGTDPGRFLITGMEKSQIHGDPFFLITQNAFADRTYLDYIRSMYGNQLYIPTGEDSDKCFQEYTEDVQKRAKSHQLKPGEDVQVDPQSGRVSISGPVAVMQINGLLAKLIFDQNSNHDFYIEQSYPLDWIHPYLEPHGLILKLNRQPISGLSDAVVQQDHDYWSNLIQPMVGDWLNDDTSVQQLADFTKKTFRQHDFTAFSGDPQFVGNIYVCKMFSKERASIAELYMWRMEHATNPEDKQKMAHEADFAFKQTLALWPYLPEAIYDYKKLLIEEGRDSEATLIDDLDK